MEQCELICSILHMQTGKLWITTRQFTNRGLRNLSDAAFDPLPLRQVSMLLQNLQQLPQVAHLMRVIMMMKMMHKDTISRLAPKTRRRGGLKSVNVRAKFK